MCPGSTTACIFQCHLSKPLKPMLLTTAEGPVSHCPGLQQNAIHKLHWPNWTEIQKLHIDLRSKDIGCSSGVDPQFTKIWIWTNSHAPHFFKFTQAKTFFQMVMNNAHWAATRDQLGNPEGLFSEVLFCVTHSFSPVNQTSISQALWGSWGWYLIVWRVCLLQMVARWKIGIQLFPKWNIF